MSERNPILITGAAGEVGGVSRTMVEMMLEQGYPVRAFVRRDDERAHSLRQAGADIFVGDLLNVADVTAALKGCRRIYFSMSLSPYYTDAVTLMAAAARAQGDIEVFVNISEFEQGFMTFEKMTVPSEERRSWLGGLVTDWSPQHRAHWIAEQVLDWSGVPTVNVRATIFVENPILTWLTLGPLSNGELRLPFGLQRIAPVAGYDVAEVCVRILVDPAAHVSKSYELTGPELKDMHGFAEDYAAVLRRQISYIPEEVDAWNETFVASALTEYPHVAEHLKTLTKLIAGGRYDVVTDQLETLLGRRPKTVRWALENNPRLQKVAAD
ncbi:MULTISPECIES: NAD(P)H-binding protein [Rhodococcus]|uniref:Hydroxylase n=1 Tax=Rhodococcus opacus M213 TaxID=1129896 RepID=K8X5J8_RHOOP|nr:MULTISPECIES: NAD(P)H-binding protein [Rhodococcus]EKT76824.1 hydroxylase [Rhodococcus opacus M213]MDI9939580.1 NAD(P)H-binding protein [Rhodococcus sp. IEGM 1351]UZG53068.1 NAD(P)H-binding protein [Rhodococcus opacus]